MEVEVQVECRTEALDEGDRTTLFRASTPLPPRTSAQLGEQRADEGAEHSTRESCVVGTSVAERIRQREYPLPDRHFGQHAIDEARCGVRHATSATRGTESAALARERNQAVVTAFIAVEPEEAVGEHATAQECAKLLLDEARHRLIAQRRAREERLQLLADDPVKERLLRLMALVLAHGVPFRDQRGESTKSRSRVGARTAKRCRRLSAAAISSASTSSARSEAH